MNFNSIDAIGKKSGGSSGLLTGYSNNGTSSTFSSRKAPPIGDLLQKQTKSENIAYFGPPSIGDLLGRPSSASASQL